MSLDAINTPPTRHSPMVKVWNVDLDLWRKNSGAMTDAVVGAWLVEAPWAHLAWHSYWMTLITLRPVDGLPDPVLHAEGMTHEFVLYAADPRSSRQDGLDGIRPPARLRPANFAAQFKVDDDAAARDKVERAISLILTGQISPDTDSLRQWALMFGDNMIKTNTPRFVM